MSTLFEQPVVPLRQLGLAKLSFFPVPDFHLDLGVLGSGSPFEEFPA